MDSQVTGELKRIVNDQNVWPVIVEYINERVEAAKTKAVTSSGEEVYKAQGAYKELNKFLYLKDALNEKQRRPVQQNFAFPPA